MSLTLHTNLGDLKIELFCDQAPKACENYLALCASGYYNGTLFHRNIAKFLIQGGDPTGSGKGGSSIWGECFDNEIKEELVFDKKGVLACANKGRPNTNGSQFFITFNELPHLNNTATIFGHVIDGFDTLDKMERVRVGEKNRPVRPISIERITIHANPIADME
ncbi:hypothetical protein AKO1_009806 [Acrasis kona]|uniref:Peptidyl-prolyl cis-trans isomerase n=1 Tax=Acrasis kona TaxID=1008807 RepID=A0AAW2ZNB7_9EUKA